MKADIEHFRMPRYREIPGIGLYLDQTIKYLNVVLTPLGCVECTPSMVSNYVKKGYIDKPVKKLYNEQQIAYLLMILIAKLVLSMDNIEILLHRYGDADFADIYNRFCDIFEENLQRVFGLSGAGDQNAAGSISQSGGANSISRNTDVLDVNDPSGLRLMYSVIATASNAIYLNHCLELMKD